MVNTVWQRTQAVALLIGGIVLVAVLNSTIVSARNLARLAAVLATTAGTRTSSTATDFSPAAFYEVAAQRGSEQLQSIDALDTKTGGIFASGSAVLALVAGLLQIGNRRLSALSSDFLVLGAISYAAMAVLVLLSYSVRTFDVAPPLHRLQQLSGAAENDRIRDWVAREHVATIQDNRKKIARKSRLTLLAAGALFCEGVLLVGSVVTALSLTWTWW